MPLAGLALVFLLGSGVAWAQQQRPPAQQPRPAAPAAPAAPAQPQAPKPQPLPPKGTEVVIVDPALIERTASAVQAIRAQDERQRQTLQSEAAKLETDLKNAEQDLVRQRTILSPEAFTQRRRDFEKRVADAQQSINSRRRDIEETFGAAYNKVQVAMIEVIADLAKENDYKVVLARSQAIIFQNSLDITGEVLQRLNKKMPSVTVQAPPRK